MPRTRNVTRAQWDLANATNSTTTGGQKQNSGCESEKENEARPATRATRSQTRTRSNGNRVVLGSLTITSKGPENTASANTSKAKGKAKAPPPKRKKLPLQDITSQFLPAPEAANRSEENEAVGHDILQQTENRVNLASPLPLARDLGGATLEPTISTNHPAPTYLDSPLPPSSPPSAVTSSPQYPKVLPKSNTSWLGLPWDGEENNLWNELDDVRPASQGNLSGISSSSDPFGFVALERKLKAERRTAAPSPLKRLHQDESDEELGRILVADTSSPRLVRRLKRPLYQDDSTLPPAISEHPHYATPPTPHKDKKKRQRLSHEEDILNSSSSSMPSTPSPSKPSTQKRAQVAGEEDNLDKLKYNLNDNREMGDVFGKTKNRTGRGAEKGEQSRVTMTPSQDLLGESMDDDTEAEKKQADPKPTKTTKSKKILKKPRSAGTKKSKKEKTVEQNDSDGDCAEKWERERQERVAYFKRLEGYQVQKEDVYVI